MMKCGDFTGQLLFVPEHINAGAPTGLWFCADAVDQMAVDDACGNAACLHLSGSWDDLDGCRPFLSGFSCIVIASPDSAWRMQAITELGQRAVGVPLVEITDGYRGAPNLAGFIRKYGGQALLDLLKYGRDLPARGLLDLADVERPPKQSAILSGIAGIDRAIGGFVDSELSVWTGRRGDGKSTFLGQILLSALNQGRTVFGYSGELPAWRFKEWVELQAAGPKNVVDAVDTTSSRAFTRVSPGIRYHISEWFRDSFFLYDSTLPASDNPDSLLAVMELAHRRRGCSVFMLDNLMSLNLSSGQDFYRAQSEFVGRLVEFSKRTGAHVHLVAHPRKTDSQREFSADDVGGSGDISNRADNVFLLERLPETDAQQRGYCSLLTVLKNRQFGGRQKIGLSFEPRSRRFYGRDESPEWHYAWEKPQFEEITGEEPVPFTEVG